jgi:hypothetical protein
MCYRERHGKGGIDCGAACNKWVITYKSFVVQPGSQSRVQTTSIEKKQRKKAVVGARIKPKAGMYKMWGIDDKTNTKHIVRLIPQKKKNHGMRYGEE